MARSPKLGLVYKLHAQDQLGARNLITSDVLYTLKFGFVFSEPQPATRTGFFKYAVESKTPNSDSRDVRVIVIPDETMMLIKVVTVMWVDEVATRAGSILE